MDITGFLFGNVNEEGELEDDSVLDKECVSQLSRLGVGGDLSEIVSEGEDASDEGGNDEIVKSPSAQDFADIIEVADEEASSPSASERGENTERFYQKGVEFAYSRMTGTSSSLDEDDYDIELGGGDTLPPPPPSGLEDSSVQQSLTTTVTQSTPINQLTSTTPSDSTPKTTSSSSVEPSLEPMVPSILQASSIAVEGRVKASPVNQESLSLHESQDSGFGSQTPPADITPLLTPTSSAQPVETDLVELPDNMSLDELHAKVKKYFPAFKPNSILRFSSLLGPGKPSSLPKLWSEAKKPVRKRQRGTMELKLDCDFIPPEHMINTDDEESFHLPAESKSKFNNKIKSSGATPGVYGSKASPAWRFGPAKVWYDQLGLPEDSGSVNYGFKLKESQATVEKVKDNDTPEDAFLMVTQEHWEDKIMWDIPYTPGPAMTGAGGVWRAVGESPGIMAIANKSGVADGGLSTASKNQSIFPAQNFELVYKQWEDDIIYDSDAVDHLPRPSLPLIDPNDPNYILGIPEEPPPSVTADKDKKDTKKSRFGSNRSKQGDSSAAGNVQAQSSFIEKKDTFNLSNDEYYNPRHVSSSQSLSGLDGHIVQHSTPALDLHPPWFPTHLSHNSLRNFHRPKLRVRCPRRDTTTGYYNILTLNRHIAKKTKEREKERVNSGGGEVFFMRTPEDVSVCDGGIVLAEYSEQYPPLISTIGMATKVKNYYRRPERQVKSHAPQLKFGETTYIQTTSSYFLGQLRPGQTLTSFENNLYRAPVYPHRTSTTDFLLVVAGDKVHIRKVDDIFVVGQECPKVEVPAPNSKPAMQFQKELLQVYLYRLFRDNEDEPKRIKMEAIRKAFPSSVISESVIRKVLKTCADFKREGYETGWWVLRQDFRLPSDEEIRSMITPEQVCTYHSMLAAEHRLKEAGYRGKSLFSVEEEEEDSNNKIDDEIRAAPWNTTHHFINATKGKYHLSVSGPADPTGCGEGFSYSRLNVKRESPGSLPAGKRYKNVMGTDGDLRKLKLSKAKTLLRNFGVPEEEISKLSRWQVVDRVRELSTEAARSGDSVDIGNLKFARGARFSQMEAQERYKDECQRIFELQNTVLCSSEVLSTDEESSNSGGESDEELGRNLETLLRGKKTSAQLSHEQEEAERQELRRMLAEDKPVLSQDSIDSSDKGSSLVMDNDDTSSVRSFTTGRRLVISRTFRDEDGREFVRDEVVKRPDVIATYIKLSSDVRSKFIQKDEVTREDMRKEKRKIQDELRRLRKMEEREKKKALKPKKEKPLTTINMRCSACGQKGHMKTNRNCPNYKNNPVVVAPTDSEVAQLESSLSQDDLVKVEGTKVVLNRAVVEHANDVRRKSLLLKFPKEKLRKRRRQPQEEDLDYLETRKSVQRRRTNPEVPFSDSLEKILQALCSIPESYHFRKPVQAKIVPDYYDVIKFPMDLQTMKENCRKHVYKSRDAFWEHINLIVTNCITYNGADSEVTGSAQKMLEACEVEMKKSEKELEQLEAEINPALDENAMVAFSYLLSKIIDEMRAVPDSWPFHHPVSARKIPDYHKIIKKPMDLQTMKKNCGAQRYLCREQFLSDLNQIVENSITYNGPSSPYTQTAETMRNVGLRLLEQDATVLTQLEARLNVDVESIATPTSDMDENSLDFPAVGNEGQDSWVGGANIAEDIGELLQDLEHSSSSSSESEMDD